jgi:glycosyltransferase involved in cell wall biosynthesis
MLQIPAQSLINRAEGKESVAVALRTSAHQWACGGSFQGSVSHFINNTGFFVDCLSRRCKIVVMLKTLIALTLNEIDGCKAVFPEVDTSLFDQILIIDGGSTDGTIEWCKAQGYEVYVQKKKGIRHAYLEAWPLVIGDVVVTISPDGNCPASAIPLVLNKLLEGYDLVIGSRYAESAKSEDDDFVTAFGNWLFTRTVNLLHRGSYTDAMVIFRAFHKNLIYELDLHLEESYELPERLFNTVISWEPLMSVRAARCAKRIADVPVGEPPRIGGVRKLQIFRWGAAYYFQFWRELWFWRAQAKKVASIPRPLIIEPAIKRFHEKAAPLPDRGVEHSPTV